MIRKRAFDICVAAVALLALAIPLLLIAIAVRVAMGRPVLFRQARPGLHGKVFSMIKFRTMTEARKSDREPLSDGERLNRFGRFLRATSLDELPELWNVLKGDMSLIGPRPLLQEYLPLYTIHQARRHSVRPGITGWAQVNGRNALTWEQKFDLDVWYVDNWSFSLDVRILLLTLRKVIVGDGINADGNETMPRFRGIGS